MTAGAEVERKFLIERAPADLATHPSDLIEQGYIALTDEGVEVRVRRLGERTFLTLKSGAGSVRLEEELEIDERRFCSLWRLTQGRRIHKTRYRIPHLGGLTIELDVYRNALSGLMTAEVEFDSEVTAGEFSAPGWFGRELTDDPRYKNIRLALDGPPAGN